MPDQTTVSDCRSVTPTSPEQHRINQAALAEFNRAALDPYYESSDPSVSPTSLDFPESKWRPRRVTLEFAISHLPTGSETFRHSGWSDHRSRVLDAFMRCGKSNGRIERFCTCGDQAYLIRRIDDPTCVRVAGSGCHDRWCLPCARDRSRAISANLLHATKGKRLRFITLTLHHRDTSLSGELDRLMHSFANLRRTRLWRKTVDGGVAVVEVQRSKTHPRWHPHLHIICEGTYLPQPRLKALWHSITGDSYIVDIRRVDNDAMLANYVTKYVTKPWSGDVIRSDHLLDEVITAMDGRRLVTTFGSWRGIPLTIIPLSDAWENLGSLDDWLYKAKQGDAEARQLLSRLDPALVLLALEATPYDPPKARDPPEQMHLWH